MKSLNGNDLKMRNKNFTSAQMITNYLQLIAVCWVCVLAGRAGGRAGRAGSCVLLLLTANVVSTAECDNSDHEGQHEITLDKLSRRFLFN